MSRRDEVLQFHVYEFPPIDFWEGMGRFNVFYSACDKREKDNARCILNTSLCILADAECSWEGDVREDELYVGGIVDPESCGGSFHYIGLKQENNGASFLIFPFEMAIYNEWKCQFSNKKDYSKEIDSIVRKFAPSEIDFNDIEHKLKMINTFSRRIDEELFRIADVLDVDVHRE